MAESGGRASTTAVGPAPTRRLFFALWPDADLQAELAARGRALHSGTGGRLMRTDSLHLTLAFLGDVPLEAIAAVEEAADGVPFAPFHFVIDASGRFPAKRLVWLGMREPPTALDPLVHALRDRLVAARIAFDPKPFVAHVTVLRNAPRAPDAQAVAPLDWPVREFALVESVAGEGGRAYRVCRRWRGR